MVGPWDPGGPAWIVAFVALILAFTATVFGLAYRGLRRGFSMQRLIGQASVAIGVLVLAASVLLRTMPIWFPLIFGGVPIAAGLTRIQLSRRADTDKGTLAGREPRS